MVPGKASAEIRPVPPKNRKRTKRVIIRMESKQRKGITVIGRDGTACVLSSLEYDLYCRLRDHRGTVVSREALLRDVWGFRSMADTRTVDMCVLRLRRKIGPDRIRSVYGKGYQMIS